MPKWFSHQPPLTTNASNCPLLLPLTTPQHPPHPYQPTAPLLPNSHKQVDATEKANEPLKALFKVSGFPTIKIIKGDTAKAAPYEGPRDEAGIVAYLKRQVQPAYSQLASAEEIAAAKAESGASEGEGACGWEAAGRGAGLRCAVGQCGRHMPVLVLGWPWAAS